MTPCACCIGVVCVDPCYSRVRKADSLPVFIEATFSFRENMHVVVTGLSLRLQQEHRLDQTLPVSQVGSVLVHLTS